MAPFSPNARRKGYFVDRNSVPERGGAIVALQRLTSNSSSDSGESAILFRQRQGVTSRDVDPTRSTPSVGVAVHHGPAHSKFSTVESRIRTFREWPPALRQHPKELAEAGFFYIGKHSFNEIMA